MEVKLVGDGAFFTSDEVIKFAKEKSVKMVDLARAVDDSSCRYAPAR